MRIFQIECRHMNSIQFFYCNENNIRLYIIVIINTFNRTDFGSTVTNFFFKSLKLIRTWGRVLTWRKVGDDFTLSFAVIKAYITNITRVYSKQVPGRPIGNHIHVHIYQKFKVRRKCHNDSWLSGMKNLSLIYSWKLLDGSCMILSASLINSNYLQLILVNQLSQS